MLILKTLHLIGVIIWFSGLFYIGRLFVYHREAEFLPESEKTILVRQFKLMERRLWYGITHPGMALTLVMGISLLYSWGMPPWIHVKLTLVGLLLAYHFYCGVLRKRLEQGTCHWTSKQLRLFNEIPVLLLAMIVPVVVFKEALSWPLLGGIVIALAALIFFVIYSRSPKPLQ